MLCFEEGAFVEMNSFNMNFPKVLVSSGRLRKVAVHILDADADQKHYYIAHGHGLLKQLNISIKGRNVLDQIEHLTHL